MKIVVGHKVYDDAIFENVEFAYAENGLYIIGMDGGKRVVKFNLSEVLMIVQKRDDEK